MITVMIIVIPNVDIDNDDAALIVSTIQYCNLITTITIAIPNYYTTNKELNGHSNKRGVVIVIVVKCNSHSDGHRVSELLYY